jgi:hypothetical protein
MICASRREAGAELLRAAGGDRGELQGEIALEQLVSRGPDAAHPPTADEAEEPVAAGDEVAFARQAGQGRRRHACRNGIIAPQESPGPLRGEVINAPGTGPPGGAAPEGAGGPIRAASCPGLRM